AHPDLGAVDPDQLAAAECESGRGQHQEEFLRAKHIERALDLQPGAGGRYVEHDAAAPPRAVDAHQVHRVAVLETDAVRFALAVSHQPASARGTSRSAWNFRSMTRRNIRVDRAALARTVRSRSAISSADAIEAMGRACYSSHPQRHCFPKPNCTREILNSGFGDACRAVCRNR